MLKGFFKWVFSKDQKKKAFSGVLLIIFYLTCRLYVYMEVKGIPFKDYSFLGGYLGELGSLPWLLIIAGELIPTFAMVSVWVSYYGIYKRFIWNGYPKDLNQENGK